MSKFEIIEAPVGFHVVKGEASVFINPEDGYKFELTEDKDEPFALVAGIVLLKLTANQFCLLLEDMFLRSETGIESLDFQSRTETHMLKIFYQGFNLRKE